MYFEGHFSFAQKLKNFVQKSIVCDLLRHLHFSQLKPPTGTTFKPLFSSISFLIAVTEVLKETSEGFNFEEFAPEIWVASIKFGIGLAWSKEFALRLCWTLACLAATTKLERAIKSQ
ncbi:MAG: hypothetical protein HYW50_01840 [Candidatus Diapherotrites archaeon]|nr:hypothetical protein [Candidatus Diapherotrites archaeon]